jgi:hypothetical protein
MSTPLYYGKQLTKFRRDLRSKVLALYTFKGQHTRAALKAKADEALRIDNVRDVDTLTAMLSSSVNLRGTVLHALVVLAASLGYELKITFEPVKHRPEHDVDLKSLRMDP